MLLISSSKKDRCRGFFYEISADTCYVSMDNDHTKWFELCLLLEFIIIDHHQGLMPQTFTTNRAEEFNGTCVPKVLHCC